MFPYKLNGATKKELMNDVIKGKGHVTVTIKYKNAPDRVVNFNNALLDKGRQALASSVANTFADEFDFFITKMVFGDGGTSGGVPLTVSSVRTGLFGATVISKNVVAVQDPNALHQAVFTVTLRFDEANSSAINEIALQMENGDLYSMATFPDINKTSDMQITFTWRLSFV